MRSASWTDRSPGGPDLAVRAPAPPHQDPRSGPDRRRAPSASAMADRPWLGRGRLPSSGRTPVERGLLAAMRSEEVCAVGGMRCSGDLLVLLGQPCAPWLRAVAGSGRRLTTGVRRSMTVKPSVPSCSSSARAPSDGAPRWITSRRVGPGRARSACGHLRLRTGRLTHDVLHVGGVRCTRTLHGSDDDAVPNPAHPRTCIHLRTPTGGRLAPERRCRAGRRHLTGPRPGDEPAVAQKATAQQRPAREVTAPMASQTTRR